MISLSSRTKAVQLGLGIFLLGIVVGATIERWVMISRGMPHSMPPHADRPPPHGYRPPPHADRPFPGRPVGDRLVHRFIRGLDLTEDQQQEIRRILDESREGAHNIQRAVRGKMDTLSNDTRSKIREVLTPEQKEKFDKMTSRMEKMRGKMGERGGRKRGGWKW